MLYWMACSFKQSKVVFKVILFIKKKKKFIHRKDFFSVLEGSQFQAIDFSLPLSLSLRHTHTQIHTSERQSRHPLEYWMLFFKMFSSYLMPLSHCSIYAEANKCILLGYFNTDFDAAPYFLSTCLFAPKVLIFSLFNLLFDKLCNEIFFFVIFCVFCSEMRKKTQELKRIPKVGGKTKPS